MVLYATLVQRLRGTQSVESRNLAPVSDSIGSSPVMNNSAVFLHTISVHSRNKAPTV